MSWWQRIRDSRIYTGFLSLFGTWWAVEMFFDESACAIGRPLSRYLYIGLCEMVGHQVAALAPAAMAGVLLYFTLWPMRNGEKAADE